MMDMDAPLDFESEDPLLNSPVVPNRRKKVIGLDDLLTDYYKEKSKVIEKESKRAKTRKNYDSDEEDIGKEALLSRKINECQNQMKAMGGEEEISMWGLQIFGEQRTPPPIIFPEVGSCSLLQSFTSHKQNSLVGLTEEEAEKNFLQGLLLNGWLTNLVSAGHHADKLITEWTFNLMLYSSKEGLRKSACEFWCAILSSENKVDKLSSRIDWFPDYVSLRSALEIYGFCFNSSMDMESVCTNHNGNEPPKDIRSWIKFVTTCFCIRNRHSIFSASETEELVQIVIFLCLDRQLQGLHVLINECLQSAISYFTDEEWNTSCEKIAKSLACRVPKDLNCLRSVDCISGVSSRSNHLRSVISYEILCICLENKARCEEDILDLLISINVKEKSCDLFKMYIYLVLTEHWLLSNPILEDKRVIWEMWGVYLRNCSCQITTTDLRPYASKVRTKASYLLNGNLKI